jgi:uncharacterized membrane protein
MNVDVNFGSRMVNIATEYVKALDVKVTRSSFRQAFEQHPHYPSVFALKKAFTRFDIESGAFDVPAQELQNLEAPFMAYMRLDGWNDFVLVTSMDHENVTYLTGNKKLKKESKQKFLDDYRKVVFVAEGTDRSGEIDYKEKLQQEFRASNKEKAIAAGGILAVVIGMSMLMLPLISVGEYLLAWAFGTISFIKLGGVAATILLLMHEIDSTNSVTRNICSATRKANCDAILSGKGSRIFGVSWSEIGFFYFAATTLLLFLPILTAPTKIALLALSGTIISPFVLFSVYYQWRIAKQWCVLCLAVQSAIVLELLWSIGFFWIYPGSVLISSDIISIASGVLLSALIPATAWYGLKPVFISAKKSSESLAEQKRLKYNPEIFNALLQQQDSIVDGWQSIGITVGNPNAKHTIIKVCNPFCGPCAVAHPQLEDLVRSNPDYKLKIIFTTQNTPDDDGRDIVRHLMAIDEQKNNAATTHALDAWYDAPKRNYNDFVSKFPMNGDIERQNEKLEAMSKWCMLAEINYTPTIFINGKWLPVGYNIEDLKNILQK